MCPHCSVGAKPTFVTALNLPLGAAFAYLYLYLYISICYLYLYLYLLLLTALVNYVWTLCQTFCVVA